jgi:predicted porin
MKKLVIASAVAAVMASGTVLAETTFGGHIRLELGSNMGETSLDSHKLVFNMKSSEDLGNGMTALAFVEYEHDNADFESTGLHNDKSYVGIKGDFGQLTLGAQGDAAGFACGATDIYTVQSGQACGVGATNGTLDNAVVYVKGFNAVTFVLGATFDGNIDTGVQQDSAQPAKGNHTVVALNFDGGAFSVGGQITNPDSDVADVTWTVLGGSVKLGEGTLGLTLSDNGADNDNTASAIAFSMPVAGGTVKVGVDAGDAVDDTTHLEFVKNLGKSAYAGVEYAGFDVAEDDYLAAFMGYKF